MKYIEIINSVILIILTVAYFIQNNSLKFMKAAIASYNPEKLKQAQEFIDKGNEFKMKLEISRHIESISEKNTQNFKEINKTFHENYFELISMSYEFLKDKNLEERESYLSNLPKNSKHLRDILEASDNGTLDDFFDK